MSSEPARVWTFTRSTAGRSIFVNGRLSGSDTNLERLIGWNGAALGRYADKFYQGTLYEVLIFNTDLGVDRRQKVEGYLAHKWGLASNLTDGHPYKTNPP